MTITNNYTDIFERRLRLLSFAFITIGIILVICNSIIAQHIVDSEISNANYLKNKIKQINLKHQSSFRKDTSQNFNQNIPSQNTQVNYITDQHASKNLSSLQDNFPNQENQQVLFNETILLTLFSHIRYENLACRCIMTGLFFILIGITFYNYILLAKLKMLEHNI